MKIHLLLAALIICWINQISFGQNIDTEYFDENLEVYFQFKIQSQKELNNVSRILSIDKVEGNTIYAYANENEYKNFLKLDYPLTILPHPGDVLNVKMSSTIAELQDWDSYPTYDTYVDIMNQFGTDYPDICKVIDAGNSVQGRKILFVKISDNVNIREAEPQFMYSSTMHGDETTGYVLMLRLIDSLLTSYGSKARITELIDNMEIWINPLANPDGSYYSGNLSVSGARRYNANGDDLNRNFPDPIQGPNPSGPWQPETIAMMNLAQQNQFVLSANFHGGAEVVNYPWDGVTGGEPDNYPHPDDYWWKLIAHEYADTAQEFSPSFYMNGFNDGITNGGDWYIIYGGRQDYFTYFNHGRETTIELSDVKLLDASKLPAHWEYNKRSLLNYMEQALYGIKGVVTDNVGTPIKAKVIVTGHDQDSSEVYSDIENGNYHRLIYAGTFSLTFEADGHYSRTIHNVTVNNNSATILDVALVPTDPVPVELISFNAEVVGQNIYLKWQTATETNNSGFYIERSQNNNVLWTSIGFVDGQGNSIIPKDYSFTDMNLSPDLYVYKLKQIDFDGTYSYSDEIEVKILQPGNYTLEQNFPNPFNPGTTIEYHIPIKTKVNLKVYNSIGQEVATLVNKVKKAGIYKVKFDASNLSSGIYFYKLSASGGAVDYSNVRKMLFIK